MVSVLQSTMTYYLLLLLLIIIIIFIFVFNHIWLELQLIFISVQLKLLNRIATVKDDGTVEFEVPGDVEPEALDARSKHVHNVIDELLDVTEHQYIPPLNIVMLIVGTRGDVQPFVAIGKRLQVLRLFLNFPNILNTTYANKTFHIYNQFKL